MTLKYRDPEDLMKMAAEFREIAYRIDTFASAMRDRGIDSIGADDRWRAEGMVKLEGWLDKCQFAIDRIDRERRYAAEKEALAKAREKEKRERHTAELLKMRHASNAGKRRGVQSKAK